MLQGDKVIEGNPGENHAMIAEKLGFPPDLIPGFVTKDGQFHYQFEEDVPKASQPEVEAQKNTPAAVTPPAAPEQSATPPQADIDEQHALETVQEAVGLNKVQAARLAELQQKNATAVPNVESQPANVGTSNVGSKVRKTFYIRPRSDGIHDILDEVQTQGGLKSPATNDVGGEYDGYKEAMTGPAALLRRRNDGLRPDDMVEAVQANFPRIKSADDLYEAIRSATAQRDNLKQNGGGAEAQTQRFWDAVSQPENARGIEKINVDQLNVGQKFRLKMPGWSHDEMTVTHVDPDSGEVTVKDGPTFGQQDLPKGAEIYIRKGTLVDNGIRHSAGDFNFDQPESVSDQKQRMAEEKRRADEAKAKQAMLDKAQRRLTGQDVDTTGEMFGRYTDKSGQQSMFSAGNIRRPFIRESQIEQPEIPNSEEPIPAVRLRGGTILPAENYPTHIQFLESRRIHPDDVESGGWIRDGIYHSSGERSDTLRWKARKQAQLRAGRDEPMFSASGNDLTPEQSQRTIKEAINEKHERARAVVQSAAQRISHVVRIAADAAFESIKRIAGRTLANTAIDFEFENTEVGKQVQAIAQQQGAKVTFYKGDETTPRGFYDPNTGRLYLRSDRPAFEILNTFEHELVHLNSASSNSTVWHLKNQIDLNSPAARQIRAGYDAWLEYKGLPKLNDELAREEITAYHLTGDHRFGVDPSLAFRNPREAVNLALDYHGANSLPEGGESGQIKFNPGTRPAAEVQRDLSAAEDELMAKARAKTDVSTGTLKERNQAANIAAAKLRKLQDELATNDEHVANTIQQQHDAITEANKILKPAGMAMSPDEWPDIGQVRDKLGDAAARRVDELANQVASATAALAKTNRLAPKMVDRITNEMMQDGRLPKMAELSPNAGRTLDKLTDYLKKNDIDSPKLTFAERLNLGKKFADAKNGIKDAVTRAWANSVAAGKALVAQFKQAPEENDFRKVMKSWIGYDQRTSLENYNYVKALVAKVPNRVRRMAMSVWLDAGGDTSTLKLQRDSVPDKYGEIWDTALKLTPDEKNLALKIKQDFEAKLDDGQAAGIIGDGRKEYGVPQRWKVAPEIERSPDGEAPEEGKPGNPYAKLDPRDPFFSFSRETPSYFDGIMAKGEPENLDIAHLTSVYDEAFHKALSSRGAIKALSEARAPDGQPVVKISGKASVKPGEAGGVFVDSNSLPKDAVAADGRPYQSVDHWALRDWKFAAKDSTGKPIIVRGDMLVHPDFVKHLKNELETPEWTTRGIGKAALAASSFLKQSKFIGPFHVVTEALHAAFHGQVPSVRGFNIDLNDPKQSLLNRNMTLGFGKARELFEEGVGSHGGIWAKVPGLGDAVVRMNNFTFNEYIPRLKMKVGLAVLDRNIARYGNELSMDQIGELTGRQMDAAFGGQNWRLMGANKSWLAVARLGLVAPDFLLSRAKVIGQAFKPYNKEQRIFLLAQAAGVYTLARVLNSIFSDNNDPHFEPHNWDSVVIGKRAYHARFIVSDAANLARDLLGLGSFNQHGIPFITGRLGVLPKTAIEAATGKDLFTGQDKDGLFDANSGLLKAFSVVAKDVAEWMTPMAVDSFIHGTSGGQTPAGSLGTALFGVSSKKETASGQIYQQAAQFNRQSPDIKARNMQAERDKGGGESPYRGLDNTLDAGNMSDAKAEYQKLIASGYTAAQIAQRYDKTPPPFTGNSQREIQFFNSLSPADQKVYREAQTERRERQQEFAKILRAN